MDERNSREDASSPLIRAVHSLLRPLIRLLVAHQVTYPQLCALLKGLYVEVATTDFPLADKRQTDSRLSLLTGVHRKDVKRLLADRHPHSAAAVPQNISLGARLIARWSSEPLFLDASSAPKPLPRSSTTLGEPSFEELVSRESKDIRPRAVLDEWLRLGVVDIDDAGCVRLRSGGFVPVRGTEEKLHYMGRNVRDHIATAVHNVLDEQPPRMERSVYSDGLSDEAIAELAALGEKLGMDMLRALNQRAAELRATGAHDQASGRMALGVYFYAEPASKKKDS